MSKDKDNGNGYAFPKGQSDYSENRGMTLRDYFAAKAMQAMITNNWPLHTSEAVSTLAGAAYSTADAMLKARAE
jgi:hypothetical protein